MPAYDARFETVPSVAETQQLLLETVPVLSQIQVLVRMLCQTGTETHCSVCLPNNAP